MKAAHILAIVLVLPFAACGPRQATQAASAANGAPVSTPAAAPAPPNAATLAAATVQQESEADAAAYVNKVVALSRGDAKFYSTIGGDPAINGEYVYLALMSDPAEGAKTFKIGDFNTWDLVEQTDARAVLRVSHSAVDPASGEIVTYEQKIAVTVPKFDATSVRVTPVG